MRLRPSVGVAGLVALLVTVTAAIAGAVTSDSPASTASMSASVSLRTPAAQNPLAGRPWAVYQGTYEPSWQPYLDSIGTPDEQYLKQIALQPKALWFTPGWATDRIAFHVGRYISDSLAAAGNPDALVQMAVFRMVPWEHDACKRLPTDAEQTDYKAWVDNFTSALVTAQAHTAIILQPDGPFALCAPDGSRLPSKLIRYATTRFSSVPNTSVYIDIGAWDWPWNKPKAAAKIAIRAGVANARGIALNSTHYSSTAREIRRSVDVIRLLEEKGITGKRAVINTSSNGHPFVFGDYTGADDNNANICSSWTVDPQKTCITLGIPPTADVTNPAWGLGTTANALAAQYVDGYMWFGRPWLYRQAKPFVLTRAVKLGAGTRWPMS